MLKFIEERYYDPATVSNKFAVGEWIEWITDEWSDGQNRHYVSLQRGIIRHIRPRVVIIAVELPGGTMQNWRIERFYLSEWVLDAQLKAAIDVWEGSHHGKARASKREAREDTGLHTVYGLADPRDGAIHYIGVSKNTERRFKGHLTLSGLNFKKNDWTLELATLGLEPILIILEEGIQGARQALKRESHWIHDYANQGAPLTNFAKMRGVRSRDTW